MAGYAHFNNSKASTKYYEPVYTNLFEVTILPPPEISGGELLIEHVKSINGISTGKGSELVEQKYKWASRSFQSGVPTSTVLDPTISFSLNLNDANELYVLKTLKSWWELAWNPTSGQQGLKKDYGTGTIIVTNFNRAGEIFWQRTLHSVQPNGDFPLPESFDYDSGDIIDLDEVPFRSDWWEENLI